VKARGASKALAHNGHGRLDPYRQGSARQQTAKIIDIQYGQAGGAIVRAARNSPVVKASVASAGITVMMRSRNVMVHRGRFSSPTSTMNGPAFRQP